MKIITIDGPASSGKGTVAKLIAAKLNLHYLESGAIYRVLALLAIRHHLDENHPNDVVRLVDKMNLSFIGKKVMLENEDVTNLIREERIGMLASSLAKIAEVRDRLLKLQHDFAREPGLVTDGRDMGSIVFPNATLKVFLTASAETRAKRRYIQLQTFDQSVKMESILNDIILRDRQDSKRKTAPLSYNKSFKVLDNSDISIDETVSQILDWFAEKSN